MSTCSLRRAFSKIHITEVMWEPYLFPCMVLRLALQNYVVGCQGLSLSLCFLFLICSLGVLLHHKDLVLGIANSNCSRILSIKRNQPLIKYIKSRLFIPRDSGVNRVICLFQNFLIKLV